MKRMKKLDCGQYGNEKSEPGGQPFDFSET